MRTRVVVIPALLVRLYGRAADQAERAAMVETFERRWSEIRRDPRTRRRWRFLVRESFGFVAGAVAARRQRPRPRGSRPFSPPSVSPSPSRPMADFLADTRYAARSLLASKTFTSVAVLTLALGIGANAAVFSVVNAVLLRPLPYRDADRLAWIELPTMATKSIWRSFNEDRSVYDDVVAFTTWGVTITDVEQPRIASAGYVSSNYFDVLGGVPLRGRTFSAQDSDPGNADVAVLGEGLWRQQFGGDPGIVGQRVLIANDHYPSRVVIGVVADSAPKLGDDWALWLPIIVDPGDEDDLYSSHYLQLVGRLAPGVTIEQARQQIEPTLEALAADERHGIYPDDIPGGSSIATMAEATIGDSRPGLLMLVGAVSAVMLIACTNVANLLLARTGARARELAVRTALGAGTWRILRQLMTESLLLALLGAAAGVAGAHWLIASLRSQLAAALPRGETIAIDATVLLFAIGLAAVASLIFGLVPALRALGAEPGSALNDASRGHAGDTRRRLHDGLVIAEVALSCALVVAAGLMFQSLLRMRAAPAGFVAENLMTLRITAPAGRYPGKAEQQQYWDRVLEVARAVPGVEAAGAIHLLPLQWGNWSFPILAQGFVADPGASLPVANFRVISPGYFDAAGVRLLAGRSFDTTDHADSARVVIVNQRLADHYWPGESALGKELRQFGSIPLQVVGVVETVRQHRLDLDGVDEMYRVHTQYPLASMVLAARLAGSEQAVADLLAAVRGIDPQVPIHDIAPMSEVIAASLAQPRISAILLGVFAALALGLGSIGVYGVTAYVVTRRTREIGIRMALGARVQVVRRGVVGASMRPVLIGLALGIVLALGATQMLRSMLYEVSPTDPGTFAGVAVILGISGLLASAIPARRASRVDPIIALRAG